MHQENFQDVLEEIESFVLRYFQNTTIYILKVHPKMYLEIKDSIVAKYFEMFFGALNVIWPIFVQHFQYNSNFPIFVFLLSFALLDNR